MTKWIKIEKSPWGLSSSIVLFDTICFYAGKAQSWGIGIKIDFYDKSLTFELFNLYAGIEVWHRD